MKRQSELAYQFKKNDEWNKLIHLITEDESFNLFKISCIICLGKSWYFTDSLLNYTGFPEVND